MKTIPNLEQFRQTGRTTRMLGAAEALVRQGAEQVIVITRMEEIDHILQMFERRNPQPDTESHDKYMRDAIQFVSLELADSQIDWDNMRFFDNSQWAGIPLLVDHSAVEKKIRAPWEMMTRYDPR